MPPDALRAAIRLSDPPTQRTPSPKTLPAETTALPCRKMHRTVGRTSDAVSTSVSGFDEPFAARKAPVEKKSLFKQPCPVVPVLPHGQADASVPSPAQKKA